MLEDVPVKAGVTRAVSVVLVPLTLLPMGCSARTAGSIGSGHPPSTASPQPTASAADTESYPPAEPDTRATLLRVAQRLNDDFGSGRYAQVYQRWDPTSRALISGADYVARHVECQTAPQDQSRVTAAVLSADGFWHVSYVLDDIHFVDYWRYRAGHWEFDLVRSNPNAVRLYRLPRSAYLVAVACNG